MRPREDYEGPAVLVTDPFFTEPSCCWFSGSADAAGGSRRNSSRGKADARSAGSSGESGHSRVTRTRGYWKQKAAGSVPCGAGLDVFVFLPVLSYEAFFQLLDVLRCTCSWKLAVYDKGNTDERIGSL